MKIENCEENIEKIFRKYEREQTIILDNGEDIHLMATDFHNYVERVPKKNYNTSVMLVNCIDKFQSTYLIKVTNFKTYFYVQAPRNLQKEDEKDLMEGIYNFLGTTFQKKVVEKIEMVLKESFLEFKGDETVTRFLKIFIHDYEYMPKMRKLFEKGFDINNQFYQSMTFESNVSFLLRFLTDKRIGGNSWITLPKEKYKIISDLNSTCQNEIQIDQKDLFSKDLNIPEFSVIAPLRILSFDIECSSYGKLPNPEKDPVITIGVVLKLHNEKEESHRILLQLGSCNEIYGCDLYTFNDERDLLIAFDVLLSSYDPDILMGYNILNFDINYLLKRRENLMEKMDFAFWGRLDKQTIVKMGKFNSKIMGFRETFDYDIFGRAIIDIYIHMLNTKKLRSYKLNSVSYEILNEQKEDVHHSIISTLQDGDSKTRNRLATYCLKDALLPLRISDKLKCIYNYVEMARVTGVPLNYLFKRGQQIRIKAQILKKLFDTNMIFPNYRSNAPTDGIGYQGADVLKPKAGYYNIPIVTLDFASLYPSIMISHNFCYSTLTHPDKVKNLVKGEDYLITPVGHYFVLPKVRKGILPEILQNLLSTRKIAKTELKIAKSQISELSLIRPKTKETTQKIQDLENIVSVLDGRQLALKISANSVYGFTGAQRGALPCLEIASSVTSIGRQMIEKTKNFINEHYNKKNNYEFDADVIYGDTDSVMINMGTKDIAEAIRLGKEAAILLSDRFLKPIKLEFEKVYYPYLLLTKKRYAGLLWTNPDKPDKKDCKGIESVRRDNCLLVRNMVEKILDIILYEKDFQKAVDYTKGRIYDLYNNRIDISQFIMSKALSKELEGENSYNSNQAHVELAKKLVKRNNVKFNIGDRIPYVITGKNKKAKLYQKSEDPTFAFKNNIPLDLEYYFENQIKPPIKRIFSSIVDTSQIFEGEHTRIKIEQKISKKKGLGMFFKVNDKFCLNCKQGLPENYVKPVCSKCLDQEKALLIKTTVKLKAKEREYQKLWSECQRCEDSLLTEVICSNSHCPIYFKRVKLQNDLEDVYKNFEKFNY